MIVRVFRPAFTVRRTLVLLGVFGVGVAFITASRVRAAPTAAVNPCSQSDLRATCQLETTPIQVGSKGFELRLSVVQGIAFGYGAPAKVTSLSAVLFRRSGQATETDTYNPLTGRGRRLSISWGSKSMAPLQFAQIKGTFVDGLGSINLTFDATGSIRHVAVPKGCRGRGGDRRAGILSGSFTLHADKLGTITQKSFRATISTAAYTCYQAKRGYGVETDSSDHLPMLTVSKPTARGRVSETIDAFSGKPGAFIYHTYTVSGLPSSDFTLNPSTLSSGHVIGGGGISGSATYTSTGSSTEYTVGRMAGSLAVTFASIGRATPFPSSRAAKAWAP